MRTRMLTKRNHRTRRSRPAGSGLASFEALEPRQLLAADLLVSEPTQIEMSGEFSEYSQISSEPSVDWPAASQYHEDIADGVFDAVFAVGDGRIVGNNGIVEVASARKLADTSTSFIALDQGRFAAFTDGVVDIADGMTNHETEIARIADVNGDGRDDLTFSYFDPRRGLVVRSILSNGDGAWKHTQSVLGDGPMTGPEVADVNADGRDDLVFHYFDSVKGLVVRSMISNGNGSWARAQQVLTDGELIGPEVADVNADGRDDLVFHYFDHVKGLVVRSMLSNGDGMWTRVQHVLTDGEMLGPEVADVNADGRDDLVFHYFDHAKGLVVRSMLSNGDGTWTRVQHVLTDGEVIGPEVADVNADGRDDLVFHYFDHAKGLVVRSMLSNGDGTWTRVQQSIAGRRMAGPAVIDVNADGQDDLVFHVSHPNDDLSLQLAIARGDGTWEQNTERFPATPYRIEHQFKMVETLHGTAGFGDALTSGNLEVANLPVPPQPTISLNENGSEESFPGRTLTVTGTKDADQIAITQVGLTVFVTDLLSNTILGTAFAGFLESIKVDGLGRSDWIEIDTSIDIPTHLSGGDGNDTIRGGSGRDRIVGGSGNDELAGRDGPDYIDGNNGNDLLIGGDGDDVLHGGDGSDHLLGGKGGDALWGVTGSDQLFGEWGHDTIRAGSGDDVVDGGIGDDRIFGDAGSDVIYAGDGEDVVQGGSGDDQIKGEGGHDAIHAGSGNDFVDGGNGSDYVFGGYGDDLLRGGFDSDTIRGESGNDYIEGSDGDDRLFGGNENDVLKGQLGNDLLMDEGGLNTLDGGSGDNTLIHDDRIGVQQYAFSIQDFFTSIGKAFEDLWEGIETVYKEVVAAIEWTIDRIGLAAERLADWIANLDDRLIRFGNHLADTFGHWPWQTEFWEDAGRTVIDAAEFLGISEIWETVMDFAKPGTRGLNDAELATARSVFGDSIDYGRVRLDQQSYKVYFQNRISDNDSPAHVVGYVINSWGPITNANLIHELTHVWQFEQDGLRYIPEALLDRNYDFGGVCALRKNQHIGLDAFNREQQGEIIETYYELRYGSPPNVTDACSPQPRDLGVFAHYVAQASTHSAAWLARSAT